MTSAANIKISLVLQAYKTCLIASNKENWQNKFITLNQQNAQTYPLDICIIVSQWIFLRVLVYKGPSSWNQTG